MIVWSLSVPYVNLSIFYSTGQMGWPPSSNIHQVFFCGNEKFSKHKFSPYVMISLFYLIVINHFMLADDRSLSMISRDENRMRALIESIKKETKQKRERPKECPNLLQRAGQVGNNSTWCKSSSSDCMVYMISN